MLASQAAFELYIQRLKIASVKPIPWKFVKFAVSIF